MESATLQSIKAGPQKTALTFTPLALEQRPTVDTAAAAYYLNRRPQTLRCWAMNQHPIRPVRISGRLHWKTEDIRRLLAGGAV